MKTSKALLFAVIPAAATVALAVSAPFTSDATPFEPADTTANRSAQSTFQQGLTADGVVDEADMDTAIGAYRDCVEAAGVTVSQLVFAPRRTFKVTLSGKPGADAADIPAIDERCATGYLSDVREQYFADNPPTADDNRQWTGFVNDCLQRHGVAAVDVDDLSGFDGRVADDVLNACLEALDQR